MPNNIINENEDVRKLVDNVPPAMANASPPMVHKIKKTRQKICDLFEEILLLILPIDSRNSC